MTSNINQFLADTNKEIEKMQKKQVSYGKNVILTAHKSLVEQSPVDLGQFMHNHIMTVNHSTNEVKTEDGEDRDEAFDFNSKGADGLKFKHGDSIYIQNNLDYADALEAGHSKQKPAGTYGVTERRMEKFLAKKEEI